MTTDQIDAIEAGPEIDALVCAAAGIDGGIVRTLGKPDECLRATEDFPAMAQFRPSTDWNDAMLAADKFGLFGSEKHRHQLWQGTGSGGGPDEWFVESFENENGNAGCVRHVSGPLAICRAILKLSQSGRSAS